MSFGALPRADIKAPPVDAVDWEVKMPSLLEVEAIDPRVRVIKVKRDTSVTMSISRRVPRVARVRARSWFDARHDAALFWARKGVHFSPQSIREGVILT